MKNLLILGLIVAGLLTSCQQEKRYSPDGVISLSLIEPQDSFPDLLKLMQETNPNMISLFMLGDSTKKEQFPFSVSKMQGGETMSIKQAFDDYVKDVSPPLTTILSSEFYEKNGKTFFRKISQTDFGERQTRNMMFYFMENDRSNVLYELKATASPDRGDFVLHQLEKIAGTVQFNKK